MRCLKISYPLSWKRGERTLRGPERKWPRGCLNWTKVGRIIGIFIIKLKIKFLGLFFHRTEIFHSESKCSMLNLHFFPLLVDNQNIYLALFFYNDIYHFISGCPLISFTMPKNVYCTFDSYCLGLECCINVKLMMFLKVFKAWARFDPCTTPMKFTMAFENYKYEIDINLSLEFDGKNLWDSYKRFMCNKKWVYKLCYYD